MEHRRTYMFYRSDAMRDLALEKAQEIFKYVKSEKRIAYISLKYLDPKGR